MYYVYDPVVGANIDGPFPAMEGAIRAGARYRKFNRGLNLQIRDKRGMVMGSILVRKGQVWSSVPGYRFLKVLNAAKELNFGETRWPND